jgi:hypothetical protein
VSRWTQRSNEVIARVLAELPPGADDAARRKAVSAAYPFGQREMHPYRQWCKAVRKALGPRRKKAMPKYDVSHLGVTCFDCGLKDIDSGRGLLFMPGCDVCREARTRHRALTAGQREEWRCLRNAAVGGDEVAAGALKDWLVEFWE